jgi:integrase
MPGFEEEPMAEKVARQIRRGPTVSRGKGEGSIFYEKGRNRWVGRLELPPTAEGKRHRKRFTGVTRVEVATQMRKFQVDREAGRPVVNGMMRVGPFLRKWLDEQIEPKATSVNTFHNYRSVVNIHLIPALGQIRLRDLTVENVDSMLRAKFKEGLSHSSVMRIRTAIVKALRYGERFDFVSRNVAALTDLPRAPRREGRSLTVEQACSLLEGAKSDRLEVAINLGLLLGLRPGEALGLTWDDVDVDEGLLFVRRSLKCEGTILRLGDTKTPLSQRTLKIPARLTTLLHRQRSRQARERLAAGELWQGYNLVVATEIGTPVDPSNYRRSLDRICQKVEIGHWHPHQLRHSYASILSSQGVPIEELSDALGHANLRMMSVYRHRLDKTIRAGVAPMERLFGSL